jgi:tRNA pseudouridine55 synthase
MTTRLDPASQLSGMLLVDKPSGVTSHDVVQVIRHKLGIRRIGHTGTLDPLASGLLILLVGRSTKHQAALQRHEKTYEAAVRLGTQTDTGDAEGAVIATAPVPRLDADAAAGALGKLVGAIEQTPPQFSAVKWRGRPAYWWARRQQTARLEPRLVRIHSMSLLDWDGSTMTFLVRCSSGTYIRTLAESIADSLGTVGHVTRLARLSVDAWTVEQAKPLRWFIDARPEDVASELRPLGSAEPVAACAGS